MKRSSVLWFWVLFSGAYLTKVVLVSPVYIAFALAGAFSILVLLARIKEGLHTSFIFVLSAALLVSYQLVMTYPPQAINLIITLSSPLIVYVLWQKDTLRHNHFNVMAKLYFLLFLIDGIWRLFNPSFELDQERLEELGVGFHIYKINSFMYIDSNFVGIHAVFILSVYLWSVAFFKKRLDFLTFSLASLSIFLTISRAAYVGALLALLVYFAMRSKKVFFSAIFGAAISVVAGSGYLINLIESDVSFNSKFMIIERAMDYLVEANIFQIIAGVGLGNAHEFMGIGAHNLLVTLVVETGVVGTICFLGLMLFFLGGIKYGKFLLFAPTLLVSMSLASLAMPYFFTLLALIFMVTKYDCKPGNSLRVNACVQCREICFAGGK